jgi:cytochrome P450
VGGYTIPKGSTVLGSLYNAMRDPIRFKDPEIFAPERFIDTGQQFLCLGDLIYS